MKILVTGAGGFVGKAIVSELKRNSSKDNLYEIFELLNKTAKPENNIENEGKIFRVDITDFEDLKNSVNSPKIDVVIHSAALAHQFGRQIKENFFRINAHGTENVARLAVLLKARHFILISSVAVYGETQISGATETDKNASGILEEAVCHPEGFYAESKFEAEKIAARICAENKIALTILRVTTVIGEEDRGNVSRLIEAIDEKRFVWIGKGENYKSLIYKKDVARACLQIIGKTEGTDIFNVTAEPVKINEIVSTIGEELNVKIPKLKISPKILNIFFLLNSKLTKIEKIEKIAATTEKWLAENVFSGEKFKRRYEFRTETPITEAIKRQVESYKKTKKQK